MRRRAFKPGAPEPPETPEECRPRAYVANQRFDSIKSLALVLESAFELQMRLPLLLTIRIDWARYRLNITDIHTRLNPALALARGRLRAHAGANSSASWRGSVGKFSAFPAPVGITKCPSGNNPRRRNIYLPQSEYPTP